MTSPENMTMNVEQPVTPPVDPNGNFMQQPVPDMNGAYTQPAVPDVNGMYAQAAPVGDANGVYTTQPVPYQPDGTGTGVYQADVPAYVPAAPVAEVMYTAPAYVPAYVPDPTAMAAASTTAPAPAHTHDHAPVVPLTQEEYQAYLVTPESHWPPPIFVRRNVSAEERFYVDNRWYSQWTFFDRKATENKNKYHYLQLVIGVGSVAVPVLVGINSTDPTGQQVLYWATVIVSLAVAIAAAVENIKKYGDNWRSYRQAAEELQQEKSLYDVKAGRYAGNKEPFTRFAERCEEVIAKQNGQFMQTVEKQQAQADQQNAELLDKYRDEGQGQLTNFSSGGLYTSPSGNMYMATDVAAPVATVSAAPMQDAGSAG